MFIAADVNLARVQREIETLSAFGALPGGGITRLTFTPAHQEATFAVAGWMDAAGLDVIFDRWGNLFGRAPGYEGKPCVLSGSHLDSVPHGGNYDGPLGVLSALEAVRLVRERGVTVDHPLEVVSFIEEEGARFLGVMGSLLATGALDDARVTRLADKDGIGFLDVLGQVEFPYPVDRARDLRQGVHAYVELHIEQGRRLETAGVPIGVVTGIAGPNFMRVALSGRSDHAGATAYADRRDTLLAAAEVIVAVREMGMTRFDERGHMTVGRIQAHPNIANVVAGETVFTVDFRAVDAETAVEMREAVEDLLKDACGYHHLSYEIRAVQSVAPMQTPQAVRDAVATGAEAAGVDHRALVSWAAHDAMNVAQHAPAGMIFVPCRDGRSHCPEEFTAPDDIAAGIAALANTLVTLATA
jgi:allantoate deiminase